MIPLSTGFDVGTNVPLDSRQVKADVTARNAIASVGRYEGMEVFVVATQKNYQLRGGIVDANWFPLVEDGEPALGNPGTNGWILSSTMAGVRSWVAQSSYSLPGTVVQTNQANTYGNYDQIFGAQSFGISNVAWTFKYYFYASNIVANRIITIPLLTGNDVLVTQDFAQTLTNKTIAFTSNTLTGVAPLASPVFTGNGSWDSPTFVMDTTNHVVGIGMTGSSTSKLYVEAGTIATAITTRVQNSNYALQMINSSYSDKTWGIYPIGTAFVIREAGVADRLTILAGGNVSIAGALSKGSGSFNIPHPLELKKLTHRLVHSFIEGPRVDLIYRGKVNLVNGKATINLDEDARMTGGTFEVLTREVQCFTTNESGWDAVKGSVIGNILTIVSQNRNCIDSISWMVIGERKDEHIMSTDWTDENGKIIMEPENQKDEVLENK